MEIHSEPIRFILIYSKICVQTNPKVSQGSCQFRNKYVTFKERIKLFEDEVFFLIKKETGTQGNEMLEVIGGTPV